MVFKAALEYFHPLCRGAEGVAGLGCGLGTLAVGLQITTFPPLASGLEQVTNFSNSLEKSEDNNSI